MHARMHGQVVERQLPRFVAAQHQLVSLQRHIPPPGINSLALNWDSAASFVKSSVSVAVGLGGTTIFSRMYSWPRPPSRRCRPLPRSLSRWPVCELRGIVISTDPSSVGTAIFAPRAASHGA